MTSSTVVALSAADAPLTRHALRRRHWAVRVLVLLGAGAIVLGLAVRSWSAAAERERRSGSDDAAAVLATRSVTGGTGPGSVEVEVRFHTPDGGAHDAVIVLDRTGLALTPGELVAVRYDADDPDRPAGVSLADHDSDPAPMPWFVIAGLGAAMTIVAALLWRWLRWTERVLRDNPWVVVHTTAIERMAGVDGRRAIVRMLEMHGAPDETTLAAPVSWRARALQPFTPTAWVAGAERDFVVASPGGRTFHRFRRTRLLDPALEPPAGRTLPSRITNR